MKIRPDDSPSPPSLTPQLRPNSRPPLIPWNDNEHGLMPSFQQGGIPPLKVNIGSRSKVADLMSDISKPAQEPQLIRPHQGASPVPITPNPAVTAASSSLNNINQSPLQKGNIDFKHAIAFVRKIKSRFGNEPDVYNSFLDILHTFQRDRSPVGHVYRQVSRLFQNHSDLLEEFSKFLPQSEILAGQSVPIPPKPIRSVPPVAPSAPVSAAIPSAGSSVGIGGSIGQPNIPYRGPSILQSPAKPFEEDKSSLGHSEVLREEILKDLSGKLDNPSIEELRHWMIVYSQGRTSKADLINVAKKKLGMFPDHLSRFKELYSWKDPVMSPPSIPNPTAAAANPPGSSSVKASAEFKHAVNYVKKIKQRFANEPEIYSSFLEILHTYQREHSSVQKVYSQISRLFKNQPDLLAEFSEFLPDPNAANQQSSFPPVELQNSNMGSMSMPAIQMKGKQPIEPRKQPPPRVAKSHAVMSLPSSKRWKSGHDSDDQALHQSPDEAEFFEKVKNYINNKQIYGEFLKCLNLFSQDILRVQDLVHLVQGFLGSSPELFNWFKKYIGYKELASIPKKESKDGRNVPELNLNSCKRYGSYRALPKKYPIAPCTGRTPLCHEVLNDSLVSCPSFNSEDSTFLCSKKNQYEEALFRCEDERYELDLLIDGNQAAIQVFEPIAHKLEVISPEEADSFSLSGNLGGTSEIIYNRAIKKVYGERSAEIIDGLKKNPAIAIPVVLKRLKQKDEEWRKLQREWNKVWREVHVKNYYKALDHQGIGFKNTDKKNVSSKALVSEIEAVLLERKRSKAHVDELKKPHLEYSFTDSQTLLDCHKLIMTFVRKTGSLSHVDKNSISKFVNNFLPEFMCYKKMNITEDLLSFESDPKEEIAEELASEILEIENKSDNSKDLEKKVHTALFANNHIYVLFRLFQTIYCRIESMKKLGQETKEPQLNPVSVELNFSSTQTEVIDKYSVLMDLILKLLDGIIESSVFEEKTRHMFGISAFNIFTIDKVIQLFVKQVMTILTESNCENLIRLFDSSMHVKGKYLTEYSIKLAAESIVKDENLFKLEFSKSNKVLSMTLIDRGSTGNANEKSIEEKWSNYVDNFVKIDCDYSLLKDRPLLYLKRSMKADLSDVAIFYNLECKICVNTYKMFFVENSEDYLYRKKTSSMKRNSMINPSILADNSAFDEEFKAFLMSDCTKAEPFTWNGHEIKRYVSEEKKTSEEKSKKRK